MIRFENVGRYGYINVNEIAHYYETMNNGYEEIAIILKDGRELNGSKYLRDTLEGKGFVTQIIPCVKPLYALYSTDNHIDSIDEIDYLGVCADGNTYGLATMEGYFDICEGSNFEGLYSLEQLNDVIRDMTGDKTILGNKKR